MKEVTRVGNTDVSTVKIPDWLRVNGTGWYETCLFRDNGESEVVGEYGTEVDALRGHVSWVNKLLEETK